jgi:hypothetical protein
MSAPFPPFTPGARRALLSIEDDADRVETMLFLLQTTVDRDAPIHCTDVRSARLMVEMRLRLLEGVD